MSSTWLASYILLWAAVICLVFIVMGLLRQFGLIQLRLGIEPGVLITNEGLERGTGAPDFEAMDLRSGESTRLSGARGMRVVLIFISPACSACRQLVPHINEIGRRGNRDFCLYAICSGPDSGCQKIGEELGTHIPLLGDPTNLIGANYSVRSTPFAYLIDPDGRVLVRGVVNSWPQIEALLKEEGTYQGHMAWVPVATEPAVKDGASSLDPVISGTALAGSAKMIRSQQGAQHGHSR